MCVVSLVSCGSIQAKKDFSIQTKKEFVEFGIVSFSDKNDPGRLIYRSWGYDGSGRGVNFNWIPVSRLKPKSLAAFSGIRVGDYIVKIDDYSAGVFCHYSSNQYVCNSPHLELQRIGVEGGFFPKYSYKIPSTSKTMTVLRSESRNSVKAVSSGAPYRVKLKGGKEISIQIKKSGDVKKFKSLMDEIRNK